jgi:hypothetical protein
MKLQYLPSDCMHGVICADLKNLMEGGLVSMYISHNGFSIAKHPWRWIIKQKRHWRLGSASSRSSLYQFNCTVAQLGYTQVLAEETRCREAKGLFLEGPRLAHTCCLPWDSLALKPWLASSPHNLCGCTRVHTWFNVPLFPT